MKKLFRKDEVLFAILWIVIYVVGFGNADNISEAMGIPKLLTCIVGLALSVILYAFIGKNHLFEYYGLCGVKNSRRYLYFIPLAVITSANLWNGFTENLPPLESLLHVISMCFVGFLEEVIFRGLLFKGMSKTNITSAIIVSSLTFGVGHIVNLLMGEPLFDTLLQLVYASAIGFCYTSIFFVSGSILPCIISHILFNSLSAFSVQRSEGGDIVMTVVISALSIAYGAWLLYDRAARQKSLPQKEEPEAAAKFADVQG